MQQQPIPRTGRPEPRPASPTVDLVALSVSLVGFVTVAYVLYEFKFHSVTSVLDGLPTRVVFVVGVLFAAAPFLVTLRRRIPPQFLLPPLFLIFFLYPLFTPYGLPYDRDPVFVYQFAKTVLASGLWSPGYHVTEQAVVYSYYPGTAIFNAEAASLTGVPLFSAFPWATELLRFLVIPAAIFAVTAHLLSPKAAPLAVLLYAVQPSIEMNIPTQQDFAVTFVLLTLVVLAFLTLQPGPDSFYLRISAVMASSVVIVSHHVSTYLLLGVVGAIAFLPRVLWREQPYPSVRSVPVFLRMLAFGALWAAVVALPVLQLQWTTLNANVSALLHPSPAVAPVPGQSFPTYEIAWIVLAILAVALVAVIVLLEAKKKDDRSFVTTGVIAVLMLGVVSIPFLSTGFSFLALREFEYTGVILAPMTAWWITERLVPGAPSPPPTPPSAPAHRRGVRGAIRWAVRSPRSGNPAFAIGLVGLLVTGGLMVPLSTRDQFSTTKFYQIDSPMFIDADAYAAAQWAAQHLSPSHKAWGDFLVYTVFGGFGDIPIVWDSFRLFNGTGFSPQAVAALNIGSYVITDLDSSLYYSYPMFFGPANDQPTAALTAGELAKFNAPAYFSTIFQNPEFTIYVVTAIPPPS